MADVDELFDRERLSGGRRLGRGVNEEERTGADESTNDQAFHSDEVYRTEVIQLFGHGPESGTFLRNHPAGRRRPLLKFTHHTHKHTLSSGRGTGPMTPRPKATPARLPRWGPRQGTPARLPRWG